MHSTEPQITTKTKKTILQLFFIFGSGGSLTLRDDKLRGTELRVKIFESNSD
jgi:hypothetical protein